MGERRDGITARCEVAAVSIPWRDILRYRSCSSGPVPLRYSYRDYSPRCTQTSSDALSCVTQWRDSYCHADTARCRLTFNSYTVQSTVQKIITYSSTQYLVIPYTVPTRYHVNVAVIGQRSTLAIILKHLYRKCSTTKVSGLVEQKDDGTA